MLSALKESLEKGLWSREGLRSELLAGITVGVIALPLSMALAIAVGAPPQHGLYTAIIAGIVIALTGGSRVNISGPTAAFVVILVPITQQYGLGGLLLAGMMAGVILIAMGLTGLGSLVQFVPYPVTIGFTAGIAVVIATLQLKDFLGLAVPEIGHHYYETVPRLLAALPTLRWQELAVSLTTLAGWILWSRRRSRVPPHLIALLAGTLLGVLLGRLDPTLAVDTLGSRFHYQLGDVIGSGIPPVPPQFVWPWQLPDATGAPIGLSFELVETLLSAAFAIAMLGALESLLCATVADGMTGSTHNPNDELIGQGIGNVVIPFFGGIPATAALARTAANVRAGGRTPLASVIHGLFILLAMLVLAPLLAWVPMASMAALLMLVAWYMSEARHFVRVVREGPRSDVATLLTCFGLTVLIDMEVAIAVGMALAALLFIHRTVELTGGRLLERHEHPHSEFLPESVVLYDINGPLFFGAAQKALSGVADVHQGVRVIIIDMSDVTMMDMTAMIAMESIISTLRKRSIMLVISNLEPRIILSLRKIGLRKENGVIEFARNIEEAIQHANHHLLDDAVADNDATHT